MRSSQRSNQRCAGATALAGIFATALMFATSLAAGAEPSSEQIWKMAPPPFSISDKGFAAPTGEGGAFEKGIAGAWYLPPVHTPQSELDALNASASSSAQRFRELGFRAPQMKIIDGRYRMFLARNLGGAAASYGPGLESRSYNPWSEWERFLRLSEADGLDDPLNSKDWPVYREKISYSIAHEMFHGVQNSYPPLSPRGKGAGDAWVREGLCDAIAPYVASRHSFMGRAATPFPQSYKSGNPRYSKLLGLRPYDYPLDLRDVPHPTFKAAPNNRGEAETRELASYMTSSFWRYLFEQIPSQAKEWTALHGLMVNPTAGGSGKDRREDMVLWADHAAGAKGQPFAGLGLFRAFPAFIAHRVEYPDQVVRSRKGVFAHPDWLEYMFDDGCPLITLTDAVLQPRTAEIEIRPLAARCLRLKWDGSRFPESGSPSVTLTATPLNSKDMKNSMESLHIGHHGTSEGVFYNYKDGNSGAQVKVGVPLDLEPLLRAPTNGELVVTFSNVSRKPLDTITQKYDIRFIVNGSTAQGVVTQPADAEIKRPASTGKAAGKRTVKPAWIKPSKSDGIGIGSVDAGGEIDGFLDCYNGLSKQMSMGSLVLDDKIRDKAVSTEPPASCGALARLGSADFSSRNAGKMGVELLLPRIPSGTQGSVAGATVNITWDDPAMRPDHEDKIMASTELVNVTISEATADYVRGGYAARFTQDLHGVVGTVSGDFTQARADVDAFESSDYPLDHLSSDALLSAHYAGISGDQLARMGKEAGDAVRRDPGVGGGSSGGSSSSVEECACDCQEFEAFSNPTSPKRIRCATQCGNYPNAPQCVVDHQVAGGAKHASLFTQIDVCPTRCADVRASSPSALCSEALWSLYQGCSSSGTVSDAEIRELLAWLVRDVPEPTKSQMSEATLKELLGADAEARERWVVAMRNARIQQEQEP